MDEKQAVEALGIHSPSDIFRDEAALKQVTAALVEAYWLFRAEHPEWFTDEETSESRTPAL